MGLPRKIAKALIIDSAAGWEYKNGAYRNKETMGYGIVPIDISKVLSTENNEIKFVLYGASEAYKTTNYAISVHKDEDDKYPYNTKRKEPLVGARCRYGNKRICYIQFCEKQSMEIA